MQTDPGDVEGVLYMAFWKQESIPGYAPKWCLASLIANDEIL